MIFLSLRFLREINFGDFKSANSAFLPHWEALNLDIYNFLQCKKAEINHINKIQSSQKWQNWHF